MRFTASSVKRELEINKVLKVNGGLGCPQEPGWTPNGNTPCSGVPASCCHIQEQTCKQVIEVRSQETESKLGVLIFNFTISTTNHDGFIDADDQQLVRLIRYMAKRGEDPIDTAKFVKC